MPDNNVGDTQNFSENFSAVRLPPFWVSKPEIWFTQVEAKFSICNVQNDKAKYNLVISNLPLEIISSVIDVINNPPDTNLYPFLKKTLIDRLSQSEEKRLDDLLSGSEMGNQKPSEFFRGMMVTAGGSQVVSQDLLLKLWKRRLPHTISVALLASGKSDPLELLTMADKIWDSLNSGPYSSLKVSEITPAQNSHSTHDFPLLKAISDLTSTCQTLLQTVTQQHTSITSIQNKINNLQQSVEDINSLQRQCCSHCRYNDNSSFRSRNRTPSRERSNICKFHSRYGTKAYSCEGTWCKFHNLIKNKPTTSYSNSKN